MNDKLSPLFQKKSILDPERITIPNIVYEQCLMKNGKINWRKGNLQV